MELAAEEVNSVARAAILVVWLVPMIVGAIACLLVIGFTTGWDIMASWIETVEP